MTRLEQIEENEAHLWYLNPDDILDPCLLGHCSELLSEDERRRIERYHFSKDRHIGLISRAMVRCLLSRYVEVKPSQWQFRTNSYGRPEIAVPELDKRIRFNVAHTMGMVAVLISLDRDVGVDVECLPYAGPCLEIAERFFSPVEVAALRALPPPEQAKKFTEYWCMKEAYIKARGLGMSLDLSDFYFRIVEDPKRKIEIHFEPLLEDTPDRWQFGMTTLENRHIVATSIEKHSIENVRLSLRKISSLVDLLPAGNSAAATN